jgi:ABC-type Co2+ transport system permease subunit|tara:strand:+ start:45 stop:293 length:249 start_codon:yes stop_codon:yes gene_type:complete
MLNLDVQEIMKRVIKYVIEGILVAIAAFVIPQRTLKTDEIMLIALTAAATFSILDTYVPSLAISARTGAGFGIGANLVGFPM